MAKLPSGRSTFFMTDLEGSTRLWEEQPAPMEAALVADDAILRETVESNAVWLSTTQAMAWRRSSRASRRGCAGLEKLNSQSRRAATVTWRRYCLVSRCSLRKHSCEWTVGM